MGIMKRHAVLLLCATIALPLLCASTLGDCRLCRDGFEKVSINGFDLWDNAVDLNDYPWSMAYFLPDGQDTGYVYVGTGNGIDDMIYYFLDLKSIPGATGRPPEIRRHRPDIGLLTWERVFDYRDVEAGPRYSSTGFRNMAVYRSATDGVNYLYASTFGDKPCVWRTATGEPGTWDLVWAAASQGSIRWMAPHNGLLYIAIANDIVVSFSPGQIWATDGKEIWPVMQDGFGNPDNLAVMSLISYNGWLYAGTANSAGGYEIWKLEGPGDAGRTPMRVVANGGTDSKNQIACSPCVFNNDLYWGTMIPAGFRFRGCEIIRIHPDDAWEVIVGPNSLSGYEGGFGNRFNAYTWWLEEHEGQLYAGTFDTTSILQFAVDHPGLVKEIFSSIPSIIERGKPLIDEYLGRKSDTGAKRLPTLLSELISAGGDLYKSADGVHWSPVFTDGLGNPYNYGVRTMVSVGETLYLGMTNPFEGLEIWRSCPPSDGMQP